MWEIALTLRKRSINHASDLSKNSYIHTVACESATYPYH